MITPRQYHPMSLWQTRQVVDNFYRLTLESKIQWQARRTDDTTTAHFVTIAPNDFLQERVPFREVVVRDNATQQIDSIEIRYTPVDSDEGFFRTITPHGASELFMVCYEFYRMISQESVLRYNSGAYSQISLS